MWLRARSGARPAAHAQTEGNPFFVGEVVRLLDEEGALTPEAPGTPERWSARIPDGVREAIGRRLDRLSRPCNSDPDDRVRRSGGSSGSTSSRAPRRPLRGRAPGGARRSVGGSCRRRAASGAAGRYQFTHALIQATLATSSRARGGRASTPASRSARRAVRRPSRAATRPSSPTTSARPKSSPGRTSSFTTRARRRVRTRGATPRSRRSPTSSARSLRTARGHGRRRPQGACSASAARSWRRSGTTAGARDSQLACAPSTTTSRSGTSAAQSPSPPIRSPVLAVRVHGRRRADRARLDARAARLPRGGRMLAQHGWFIGFIEATTTGRSASSSRRCRSPSAMSD